MPLPDSESVCSPLVPGRPFYQGSRVTCSGVFEYLGLGPTSGSSELIREDSNDYEAFL